MNDLVPTDIKIEDIIYEIRGQKVILDSDLAKLYNCANGTKTINLAVKRHIELFSNDYYFQLNLDEFNNLKFQFETSSWNNYGGIRKLPYVFTEEGITILSSILRSKNSKKISERILSAFRNLNKSNLLEASKIKDLIYEIRGEQVMLDSDLALAYS